jgi:PAS domain S-box-containing protein
MTLGVINSQESKILVVDDNKGLCKTLKLILERCGYIVDIVHRGNEVLDKVQDAYFNVALIDIRFPDINGTELLSRFKEISPEIATVLISEHASVETTVQALELDTKAYITKPLDMDEVMRTLSNVLTKQHLLKEIYETERALREQRDRTQMYLTVAGVIMLALDIDGNITLLNKKGCEILGCAADDVVGSNWFERFFPEDEKETIREVFYNILNEDGGQVEEFENYVQNSNGERRLIMWNTVVLRDIDNQVIGTLSSGEDITERKKAEEKVRRLNEDLAERDKERTSKLEAANRELEAFSYSISHDLHPPLRSIDGFSKALLKDYNELLDDEGKEYLRRLRAAAVQMGELIDGVLTLSRVTRKDLWNEVFDLSQIADVIAKDLKLIHSNRIIEFKRVENIEAFGDERLLRLVLENLIGNSWKFTATRNPSRIEFGKIEEERKTIFLVRDNGVDFDMSYIDKLFGPFQCLHHTDDYEGAGIGLATVRRIINRHGGQVWAEGEVDKGATFYFTLPLKEEIN